MFRFTIRDVLWLTAVVALGVGWWADHARQMSRQREAAKIHNQDLRQFLGELTALKEQNASLEMQLRAKESSGPELQIPSPDENEPAVLKLNSADRLDAANRPSSTAYAPARRPSVQDA
jgi:hypothetical protein